MRQSRERSSVSFLPWSVFDQTTILLNLKCSLHKPRLCCFVKIPALQYLISARLVMVVHIVILPKRWEVKKDAAMILSSFSLAYVFFGTGKGVIYCGHSIQGVEMNVPWRASAFQSWYVQTYVLCSIWQESSFTKLSLHLLHPTCCFQMQKAFLSFSKIQRQVSEESIPAQGWIQSSALDSIMGVPELPVYRMNEIFFTLCLPQFLALLPTMKSWKMWSLPRAVNMKT